MLKKELEEYVEALKEELDEAHTLLGEYERLLCVRFCGWLRKVIETLKFWQRG